MYEAARDCGYVDPNKVEDILEVTPPEESLTMITKHPSDQLIPRQIIRIAAAIKVNNMAAIAEGYLDIDDETIKNKKYENKDDTHAFNREMLKVWLCKNPHNQVKVSLKIQLRFVN